MMRAAYDYVIIGGGTAGAVVGRRLADAGAGTIAILEAGPSDEGRSEILELRRWPELLGSELDYDYPIERQQRGNSRMRHSRGKMLGGCSSHNSCIAFRPPAADFDRWSREGASGWDAAAVAPAFERVLATVHLEKSSSGNAAVQAFIDSCAAAGLPRVDFSRPPTEGADWFVLNKKDGQRQSSSVAYLHPLSSLPEALDVVSDTRVTRIEMRGARAAVVHTERGAIEVGREVILCAGAFDSPRLLMLSGIGDPAQLAEHGIAAAVALPGVGEGLVDHPEGVVVFECSRPVPAETAQLYEAGCFYKSDPALEVADVMLHFGTESFDMWTEPAGYPTSDNAISMTPNVTRARSRGTVRLRSAEPGDRPLIDFRYFTDPDGYDERTMVEGLRLARAIAAESPLREWISRELAPGPELQDFEALSAYLRETGNTVYHPAGTCRMGEDDDAVVDPELRVRGTDNLRVADASIFPSMISVNPCLTCMMIGERCAELIAG